MMVPVFWQSKVTCMHPPLPQQIRQSALRTCSHLGLGSQTQVRDRICKSIPTNPQITFWNCTTKRLLSKTFLLPPTPPPRGAERNDDGDDSGSNTIQLRLFYRPLKGATSQNFELFLPSTKLLQKDSKTLKIMINHKGTRVVKD